MRETATEIQCGSARYRRVASPLHTAIVLAAIGIQAYRGVMRGDEMRAAVNPNRIGMYERTILVEWLLFAFVILGVWLSGSPLAAVVGERWRSVREVAWDIGVGVAFMVVAVMFTSMIGSHAHGADANQATQFLLPRSGVEIALWIALSMTAGICEEAVYRGYLQRQFQALTRSVPGGILLSAAAFGGAHAYQGVRRAVQIGALGAMAGLMAHWRRSVRPGVIAHALQDILVILVRK